MTITKKTYRVIINYHGELHEFYTTTATEELAISNSINRLGKKLKISGYSIRNHVNGRDKVSVKQVESKQAA